ncbi:MAG: TetR/AcrR family transcriptional regulator [Rhodococcus sp. (in: high G+C Gram-positive bacteria)]|nr:MAG: TetR/AcrR family transcriptional regulator [Rhodococcus sp. (in: high G+C Gram-positive bacteria)]
MARPKTPLIDRGVVLDTALKLIDESGVDALSIRRLADELGVNGASLYHHFTNKDAILVEATERALKRTPMIILDVPDQDWRSMLLSGATQLLDLLQSHPGLVPIIIKRRSMGMANRSLEVVAGRLQDAGVPLEAIFPMFEAVERFVLGWATRDIAGEAVDGSPDQRPTPNLDLALAANSFTSRQLFETSILGILNSISQTAQSRADIIVEGIRSPSKPSRRRVSTK